MIKFVQCVTRKPGMETTTFRNRWNEYGRHLEDLARDRPNVIRFRLSTTVAGDGAECGTWAPYDGMLEVWVNDPTMTVANLRDPKTRRWLSEVTSVLREFVDDQKSTAFFAIEEMGFDRRWAAEETIRQF